MDYVKFAAEVWEKFKENNPNELVSKYFHLRPASSYVQLITTVPIEEFALTGFKCTTERGRVGLINKLEDVNAALQKEKKSPTTSFMKRMGFNGTNKIHKTAEHLLQSNFINMLNGNSLDKKKFEKDIKSSDLTFIASEFVIHKKGDGKKDILDVIAYDGETLYMIELKVGAPYNGTKGLREQIGRYIGKYGTKGTKFKQLCELLRKYPINNVVDIKNVKFFAVSSEKENDVSSLKVQSVEDLGGLK
jgi:Holliday junction resolvase